LFGFIAIFKPSGPVHAFTIDGVNIGGVVDGIGQFGKTGTFFGIAYQGMREITKNGVSAIPDPTIRAAVSTAGSISALAGGFACGVRSVICAGMGWEQKVIVCVQGIGVCAGIATGLHEGDPGNPATIPGRVASEGASKAVELGSA
jgi:hypothetical protein